jgi:hypothetical protein
MEPTATPHIITTTLTADRPVAFVQLASGNTAAIDYSMSFGEIVIAVLLLVLTIQVTVFLWRYMSWKTQ